MRSVTRFASEPLHRSTRKWLKHGCMKNGYIIASEQKRKIGAKRHLSTTWECDLLGLVVGWPRD